jgi:hypothetical protein
LAGQIDKKRSPPYYYPQALRTGTRCVMDSKECTSRTRNGTMLDKPQFSMTAIVRDFSPAFGRTSELPELLSQVLTYYDENGYPPYKELLHEWVMDHAIG